MKQLICVFALCCIACTTAKYPQNNTTHVSGTVLPVPTADELAEKSRDSIAESYIEIGTPDSLRNAVRYLSTAYKKVTAEKQLYLSLITRLMDFLYPLERTSWRIQSFEKENSYLDALDMVTKGKYPQKTDMNTFLSTLIPALILVKDVPVKNYTEDIELRIDRALQLNSKSVLPYYLQGLLYERQNRFFEAETAYKKAWDKAQSCYPAGMHFARLALQHAHNTEVSNIVYMLAEQFPDSIEVQTLLAQMYCAEEKWKEAYEIVKKIQDISEMSPDVFFLQIRILIRQKKYLQATMLLDSYAKKNKTEKRYLLLRTEICRGWTKNTAESQAYLTTAYHLYPHASDVLRACAELCFETGETISEKTTDDFISLLLRQDSKNAYALRLMVKQDIIRQDWDSAFKRAESLYESDPSEANRLLYIESCIYIKRWREAVRIASAAYDNDGQPSTALTSLYLEALFGARMYGKLRSIIGERLPESRTELKSVLLYYEALIEKNSQKKLSLLRLSLLTDPRNTKTLFALYEWYYEHDDYKKAHYYLQQVIAFEPNNRKYARLNTNLIRLLEK